MESAEYMIEDDHEQKIELIDLTEEGDSSKQKSKTGSSKVIDYMFQRQKGQSNKPLNLSSIGTDQFTPKRFFYTTHGELHIGSCEYIKAGLDGESVVGLWEGNQYDGIVYKLQIKLNSSCSSRDADAPVKTIASVKRIGPYFVQTCITDMADTYLGNQNCVLYVGKKRVVTPGLSNSVACTFACTSPTNGKQYMLASRQVTCCSGCRYDNLFGVGTTEGIIIYKDEFVAYSDEYNEKINAMELSRYGNVVYCGCDSAHLIVYDLRSESPVCYKPPMKGMSNLGISNMKLLSNENELIVSDFIGNLGKIDMRYNGIVTSYPGHRCFTKTPFTASESADLVCATGSDNVTRIWSNSTGELLHKVDPWIAQTKTHSALFSSGLRWGVAMFQKKKMYVIEPWA